MAGVACHQRGRPAFSTLSPQWPARLSSSAAVSDHWTLTVRAGGRTRRARHESLDDALAALGVAVEQLAVEIRRQTVNVGVRRFEPVQQVAARAELSGPGRVWGGPHGGIDIRGDGSQESFVGRARRELVSPHGDESPVAALGRMLQQAGPGRA